MAENTNKIGFHAKALVTVATLALVGGCATNPFENLPDQISTFFKDSGLIDDPDADELSMEIAAANEVKPAALELNNDLSHMLERVADTALANRNYGAAARIYGQSRDLAPNRPGAGIGARIARNRRSPRIGKGVSGGLGAGAVPWRRIT